jgi:hypothetical protein
VIYNTTGIILIKDQVNSKDKIQLNLDWLPSGEYFVVLANDKEYSESKKIIKQ